jgi:hypothetical protein
MRKKTQILLQAWKLITRTMRKNRDEEKKNYLDHQNQHKNYKRIGRHEKNMDLLQALHPTLGSQKIACNK